MSKQDRNTHLIEGLIDKYRLDQPVEDDYRRYSINSKPKVYKKVLRKLGKYTVITGIVSWSYFSVKKSGLPAFVLKMLGIITVSVSLVAGSYFLYKYFFDTATVTAVFDKPARKPDINTRQEEIVPEVRYSLSIRPFVGTNISQNSLKRAAYYFDREFARLRGKDFATRKGAGLKERPVYTLQGSVDAFGEELIVFVKLVDTRNTKIVYTTKEIIDSEKELRSVCKKLARKVSRAIK